MKKLITMLSAFTITTTVVPTIVACGKEEKGLNLTSLSPDSFNQLDIINGNALAATIETKKLNEISDDQTLVSAIESHIRVMTLKKVFGLSDFAPKSDDDKKAYAAFVIFWGVATPPILDIKVEPTKEKKTYKITITKAEWEKIKIDTTKNSEAAKIVKPYYDLIQGEKVEITITNK